VDKHMMRLVMWINKGPTDFSANVQFTDWDEVERFAGKVAQLTAGADVTARPADALAA
jgi:menaquinone-dependent protoporphyrinogen oxidase